MSDSQTRDERDVPISDVPIQIEGARDDGAVEVTPPVVADRDEQSTIDYQGWDDGTAREQENLPEDEQQA